MSRCRREPGNIIVIIFPDSIFKYTTSVRKHLPHLFPKETEAVASGGDTAADRTLRQLLDNARLSPDVIDMGQIDDLIDDDAILIDVRTSEEYAEEHAEGAINLPLAELEEQGEKHETLPKDKEAVIITICNVGKISLSGMLLLKSLGYNNTKNLEGGLTTWMAEGGPSEM